MLFQCLPEMFAVNVGNSGEILDMVIKIPEAGHQVRVKQECPPIFGLVTFLDGFEVGDFKNVFLQDLPHRANLCDNQSKPSILTVDQSWLTCSLFTDSLGMRAVVLKSSGCHSVMPRTSRGGSMGDMILCLPLTCVVTVQAFLMPLNTLLTPPMVIT